MVGNWNKKRFSLKLVMGSAMMRGGLISGNIQSKYYIVQVIKFMNILIKLLCILAQQDQCK